MVSIVICPVPVFKLRSKRVQETIKLAGRLLVSCETENVSASDSQPDGWPLPTSYTGAMVSEVKSSRSQMKSFF